ncbi:MAG: tetratricopeptide repeat protein [Bacteroidia bacterium]|nr:tetratricopeptide repeat protein [Bacteroidia bacterium]
MKKSGPLFLMCLLLLAPMAAQVNMDSLREVAGDERQADSSRIQAIYHLSNHYEWVRMDSFAYFTQRLHQLSVTYGSPRWLAIAHQQMGFLFQDQGMYDSARQQYSLSMTIARTLSDAQLEANNLNNLGQVYEQQGQLEKALSHFHQSLAIREKTNRRQDGIPTLNNIAKIHLKQGELDRAMFHLEQSLEMAEVEGDTMQVFNAVNLMGIVFRLQGNHEASVAYHRRALALAKDLSYLRGQASSLGNIAIIFQSQGDYAQALIYYQQCLEVNEASQDIFGIAATSANLGNTYTYLKRYEEATEALNRSLEIYEKSENFPGIANTLGNLGLAYEQRGQEEQAIGYYLRSIAVGKDLGYAEMILPALSNLAGIHTKRGEFVKAIGYGQKALTLSRQTGNIEVIKSSAQQLYACYRALNQPTKALAMHELYHQMRDSLNSEENQRATIRFEYQQQALADSLSNAQEKALAQVEYENQLGRQRLQLGFAAGIGGLLALLAVVLFVNGRRRRKTNELLRLQKGEIELKSNQNELLLKEIHHRVKNNLQTISSLLYLQSAHIKDAGVKEAVVAGQHRVESMALIHQKLYQRENLAAIEMKDYLTNLGQSLLSTFGYPPERIGLHIAMEELELDVDTAVPLGLIVNELITNSLKYAFPDERSGTITVSLKPADAGLELFVGDDGVGAANTASGTSFGSQLVRLLTTQLGGQLEQGVENGYWTRVVV